MNRHINQLSEMPATALSETMDCLIELQRAIDRSDELVARTVLRTLIGHSAYLTDFDDIFKELNLSKPNFVAWRRWSVTQLRMLRGEAPRTQRRPQRHREKVATKPYPDGVAAELASASLRVCSGRIEPRLVQPPPIPCPPKAAPEPSSVLEELLAELKDAEIIEIGDVEWLRVGD